MKKVKSIYGLFAATALMLASCSLNEAPTFDDSEAFVAFTNTTMSVGEADGTLEIPVLLTSISGISETVEFEITANEASPAVEGTHYTLENSTLTFTKEAPTQYIKLNIIDNATFNGDVKLSITLKKPSKVNLGTSKSCSVTIEDDEHPLLFILGTLQAKGNSYFNGDTEWTVTIEKDADDLSKVWIGNLVPDGSNLKVYGVVNADKTEIRIPVGQEIVSTGSYPHVLLEGFRGEDGDEDIPTGENILGTISPEGVITIQDWFGSHVYTDDAATASAGWFNIMTNNVVFKK